MSLREAFSATITSLSGALFSSLPPPVMARLEGSTSGLPTSSGSENIHPRRLVRSTNYGVRIDSRSSTRRTEADEPSSRSESVSLGRPPSPPHLFRRSRSRLSSRALSSQAIMEAQSSLTLEPSLVVASLASNGGLAGSVETDGSLTSTNNFINFCDGPLVPIADGLQVTTGSCNPAPIGKIPTTSNMPSVLITTPRNGDIVEADSILNISLAVQGLKNGVYVNPSKNFLAAPQTLDSNGKIVGHYHLVIEELDSLNSTTLNDIQKFVFHQIVKNSDTNGSIKTSISDGLPEGFYRMTATIHAANYQPIVGPVSQHGSFNDASYFTVIKGIAPASDFNLTGFGQSGLNLSVVPARPFRPRSLATPKIARRSRVAQKPQPPSYRPSVRETRAVVCGIQMIRP
ncbi:hypothetical protein C8J57DRAFT_305191 [Mycena rebaudengoi]|nr:hypothetical protein C8J57DRAFT_305191 [Mycena rebaudengoi]